MSGDFASRLRDALRGAGKPKLYAIAADLGVSMSAVSRWQNGKTTISLPNALRLCVRLGVSADWLLLNRPQVGNASPDCIAVAWGMP